MINCTNLAALLTKAKNMGVIYRLHSRVIDFLFIHEASMAVVCIVQEGLATKNTYDNLNRQTDNKIQASS